VEAEPGLWRERHIEKEKKKIGGKRRHDIRGQERKAQTGGHIGRRTDLIEKSTMLLRSICFVSMGLSELQDKVSRGKSNMMDSRRERKGL